MYCTGVSWFLSKALGTWALGGSLWKQLRVLAMIGRPHDTLLLEELCSSKACRSTTVAHCREKLKYHPAMSRSLLHVWKTTQSCLMVQIGQLGIFFLNMHQRLHQWSITYFCDLLAIEHPYPKTDSIHKVIYGGVSGE